MRVSTVLTHEEVLKPAVVSILCLCVSHSFYLWRWLLRMPSMRTSAAIRAALIRLAGARGGCTGRTWWARPLNQAARCEAIINFEPAVFEGALTCIATAKSICVRSTQGLEKTMPDLVTPAVSAKRYRDRCYYCERTATFGFAALVYFEFCLVPPWS